MALLRIAGGWARAAGRRLLTITVDHGLNPDSRDWSRRCEAAARSFGADWIERRWAGDKPVTGLPAAARRARHALIADAAREAGARVVLFAHTADDIAESDWMRARSIQAGGSTLGRLREWSPSPTWPQGRGLMLLRPMLSEGREGLRRFLRDTGQDWIEDPGNAAFGRGQARAALSRLTLDDGGAPSETDEGGVSEKPATSAPQLGAQERSQAVVRTTPLPLGEGFEGDRSIGGNALAVALSCASGIDVAPRRDRLDALASRLVSGEDFTATLSGARIEASGDRVVIGREPGEMRRRRPADVVLTAGTPNVWDGRYEITAGAPGWTATAALGRLNALSKVDRAIAATAPAWARAALPVLIRDGSDAPVLAWRAAEVRNLAPRRLTLALGETTQESDLARTIHGETPPADLF
ncbi:MAG: PP-loop family protein [Alphaproteobacteria bacterium]|nr:PP-loop family protein [Alphaproteobacteria bacterium]MBU2377699.1 PP-loop family protein [Alphaproteobacteria bacterium]